MFTLFGILSPAQSRPVESKEAPFKRSFFGAPADHPAVPLAEQDACYLTGKGPEPEADRSPSSQFARPA